MPARTVTDDQRRAESRDSSKGWINLRDNVNLPAGLQLRGAALGALSDRLLGPRLGSRLAFTAAVPLPTSTPKLKVSRSTFIFQASGLRFEAGLRAYTVYP